MRYKPYKQFFHGKGISKTANGHKPMKWIPWTYLDTYNAQTGHFRSRRKYGADGWAYKDMDTADEVHKHDHIHEINRGNRAKIPREPNKIEKKEFKKAKQKRRLL